MEGYTSGTVISTSALLIFLFLFTTLPPPLHLPSYVDGYIGKETKISGFTPSLCLSKHFLKEKDAANRVCSLLCGDIIAIIVNTNEQF